MTNIEDIINARKARYLTVAQLYESEVLDITAAIDCLKGNLDPDDDGTFYDDSNLPVKNTVQGLYMIELSGMFIP